MDRPIVARATSNDDSPTPAYLYGDIAQMTHANFEGCRQLTEYLLQRIKKPNHNIKFKCLQIIKHVCLKGRTDFKIAMAREAQVIKDCLTFSGPPDPLRGEEIYRKVREAAKDTLEAVFAENPPPGAANAAPRYASGNRIEGFGSAPSGDPSNPYGSSGNGIGGGTYGGYGGGGGYDSYSSRRPASGAAAIGAVGSVVGAAVGKAMGSLRGRSSGSSGLMNSGNDGYGGGGGYGGGSSGGDGGGPYGGGGGSSMQGMGNYDPSKDKTWLERTSETVRGSMGTSFDAVQRRLGVSGSLGESRYVPHNDSGNGSRFSASSYMSNRGPNAYDNSGYRAEAVSSAYEEARASSQAYASQQWNRGGSTTASYSGSGVRGGWGGAENGAASGTGYYQSPTGKAAPPDSQGEGGGNGDPTFRRGETERGPGFVGRTGGGDSDGGYEGKLVEEICAAGGTRSTPGKPELDAFLSKAASLDPSRVAESLLVALGAADWRARSKGLAVVEALHRSNPSYRIPLEDAFQDSETGVIPLCSDSKPAVRDRAVRVSKLLGLDMSSGGGGGDGDGDDDDDDDGSGEEAAIEDPSSKNDNISGSNNNNGYSFAPDGGDASSNGTAAAPSGQPVDLLGGFADGEAVAGEERGDVGQASPGFPDMVGLHDDGTQGEGEGSPAGGAAAEEVMPAGVPGGGGDLDDFLGLGPTSSLAEPPDGRDTPGLLTARAGEGDDNRETAAAATAAAAAAAVDKPAPAIEETPDSLFGDLSVKDPTEVVSGVGCSASGGNVVDRHGLGSGSSGEEGGHGRGGSGFAFMATAEVGTQAEPVPPPPPPGQAAGAAAGGGNRGLSSPAGAAQVGAGLLSGLGGSEASAASAGGGTGAGLDMLVMSPDPPGSEDASEATSGGGTTSARRKQPAAAVSDLLGLALDPLASSADLLDNGSGGGGQANVATGDAGPKESGSLLDWATMTTAAAGSSGGGDGGGASEGLAKAGVDLDRNRLLQEKVLLMQQDQRQRGFNAGTFGGRGTLSSLPGGGPGAGMGFNAQAGGGAGRTTMMMGSGSAMSTGKAIPDPGTAWAGSAGGTAANASHQPPPQRQVPPPSKEQGFKPPDSFSFVLDAMHDSIK